MGDTGINIPIDVRSHEHNQLTEVVPKLVSRFQDRDTEHNNMGEQADELHRVYDEHIDGMDSYLSMPLDDWRTLISGLSDADDGLRGWYLQKKLLRRLRDKSDEIAQ